jgi:nitroreductase
MDVLKVINQRYSVRAYKPDPVEDEKLLKVLYAARMAPTANNQQPFQIIVIHTKGKEEELLSICSRTWLVQAPILLCLCAKPDEAWVRKDGIKYYLVDIAIVMDHIILAAASLGLGTCIIGAFNLNSAHKVLSIPETVEPVLFTPLGYPADKPKVKERKALEDLVRYEHW